MDASIVWVVLLVPFARRAFLLSVKNTFPVSFMSPFDGAYITDGVGVIKVTPQRSVTFALQTDLNI